METVCLRAVKGTSGVFDLLLLLVAVCESTRHGSVRERGRKKGGRERENCT